MHSSFILRLGVGGVITSVFYVTLSVMEHRAKPKENIILVKWDDKLYK